MLENLAGKMLEPGAERLGDRLAEEIARALREKFSAQGLMSPVNEREASALQVPALVQPLAERENALSRERHQFALQLDTFRHEQERLQSRKRDEFWHDAKTFAVGAGIGAGIGLLIEALIRSSRPVVVRRPRYARGTW